MEVEDVDIRTLPLAEQLKRKSAMLKPVDIEPEKPKGPTLAEQLAAKSMELKPVNKESINKNAYVAPKANKDSLALALQAQATKLKAAPDKE